ncbi:DUF262 domain-containing protein [Roseovarius sp. SYSU LYC5161]|uniref:DUF262 domain-containing protein n=1 Tax=Roseovarius halophilus (ex Wu et al. 2025) TaxID=3376060 RepID=UPI00399AA70D
MKQTIKAEEQELKRIFSDDYLFEIPAYQRPYSWTTEQTSELLDDLMVAMGSGDAMEEVSPYFLGSIVLIKDPNKALAKVVDGQQRLTTLTILFCVLRELSNETGSRSSLDKYVCEKGDKFAGSEDRFRLSLRERDREFFREKVQADGRLPALLKQDKATLTDSQQRIHENANYLWLQLSKLDQVSQDRLTMFLVQRCYLVVVAASDQNSAYRIFSVMNDRGLDLSPTDILKADIIGAMPETIRGSYTDQWEEIEEELGREDFKDLFAHIRMVYVKSKARGNLNQEFRDGVLSRVNGRKFIDEVLTPFAEVYQVVSRAAFESTRDADKVNSYLIHLSRLDNYDWVPPAIAFFNSNRDEQPALEQFVRDLERLAYGLFILRANINDRINRYGAVLRSIENRDDLFDELSPLQLTPDEKSDILSALGGPIYLQTRVRMPLLLRVDSLLADQGATYEHKVLSIEHVLPQNPAADSTWLKWFPDADERELWTHRLANLVLLSRQKNTQAQNYDFERKKKEYFQKKGVATFATTSQVLSEPEWNAKVLEDRQSTLLGKLKSEWRL